MKVVVRADASQRIGTGHIVRCRTLAEELRRRGAEILFVTRAHAGHMAENLRKDGFETHLLPASTGVSMGDDASYEAWLGVSENQDADDTLSTLKNITPDWLVVDHYALSSAWEKRLKSNAAKILALDDLGRAHAADLVFDQNFSSDPATRYAHITSPLLLGPRYALLRPEYAVARTAQHSRAEAVARIVVFFGGTDPAGVTGLALDALDSPEFKDIAVDVVVGSGNPNLSKIKRQVEVRSGTTLHIDQPGLSVLFAAADLALGAGGGTMWERCCLGLPTLVISIAENQVPASRDLHAAGLVRYLGPHDKLTTEVLRAALAALIADSGARIAMSELCARLVDGNGVKRVAEAMMPTPADQLYLRPAAAGDCTFYFDLVNDPAVRRQSFNSAPVAWPSHRAWFTAKLANPESRLFVLEAHGLPLGQIRFDRDGDDMVIDYSLDPLARGRGWGTALVRLGARNILGSKAARVRAEVKADNAASCAAFERTGFQQTSSSGGKSVYVLDKAMLDAASSSKAP